MRCAKLDYYDCTVKSGAIMVKVDSENDPALVDILSEIAENNGQIFYDGDVYIYQNNYIATVEGEVYLVLQVI